MRRVITFLFWIVALAPVASYAVDNCLICHGRTDFSRTEETGRKVSLFVDTTTLAHSVHASRACTDCHVDITAIPHKTPQKVACRRCHYSGNPVGAPQGEMYDQYEHSVHGLEVAKGNPKAPVCQDCHGTHEVKKTSEASSPVFDQNLPRTCGECHIDVFAVYKESIHGTALASGNHDAPSCGDCHGEHNIQGPTDTTSSVSPTHVAATCSSCHGPVGIVSKYGIETDRTTTYEHSFHGIAREMNNLTVANCASCHGFHDIRPASDPKSSINAQNIVNTCGQKGCHPEATPQFAGGKIHVDPHNKESGLIYYITKFFTILTVGTLAGLFALITLDLFRRAREARDARERIKKS